MEQNPKKSKALIITFIVVLLLLVGIFFFFSKQGDSTSTKGATASKSTFFSSLFGSSKQKQTVAVDTSSTTKEATVGTPSPTDQKQAPTNTVGSLNSTSFGNSGQMGSGSFGTNGSIGGGNQGGVPLFNPLPAPGTTTPQTNTPTTNNTPTNTPSTGTPDINLGICKDKAGKIIPCDTKTVVDTGVAVTTPLGICQEDPLVFTPSEQIALGDLLKKYYLLESSLKTDEDILLLQQDASQYTSQVDQIDQLIGECEAQKADTSYTGPREVLNNPYYTGPSESVTYVPGEPDHTDSGSQNNGSLHNDLYFDLKMNYDALEQLINIW